MPIKLSIWFRLHVSAATLLLVLSWISVPLSLAAREPDVCEVECCIAKGKCCCAIRRTYVKGHEPKPGVVSLNVESKMTIPCPASCSPSGISAKNNLPRATLANAPIVTPTSILIQNRRDRLLPNHQIAAQPSSPRAPPTCDRLIV